MPNPNHCLRYWDLADHIRIDDAIALWCGVESAELASLNFETQCMSAKRAALVAALRTERLEYEDLAKQFFGEEVRGYASFHKKVGAALKTFSKEIPQRLRDS